MTLHRRTVLKGIAATAGAGLAAPAIAQVAPFKIGLLTVKTGPLAQGGIQMEQGLLTFLKERASTLSGRKIELVVADSGGNPAGAKTKAQELVERDKVSVILGPLAAFEMLAITDYVAQTKTPLIAVAAAEDVTQRKANPFIIRPTCTSGQCSHAMADYAIKELKFKRAATISEDFAFGHEQMAAFQRVFEEGGGKVVKKLWPPLVTPDYTPFIAQIGTPDCVFSGFAGSNPVKFMRAYADLGLKGKVPLLGGWTFVDDALLKSLGSKARRTSVSSKRCRRTTTFCRVAMRPACTSVGSAWKPRSRSLATSPATGRHSPRRCTRSNWTTRRADRSRSTNTATPSDRCSSGAQR